MEMKFVKRLGIENARKVLKAISKDDQHFGFIQISEEELADLTSLYSPSKMALGRRDVFSFRAGGWMIVIVVHEDFVEVTIINPYDFQEDSFTTYDI